MKTLCCSDTKCIITFDNALCFLKKLKCNWKSCGHWKVHPPCLPNVSSVGEAGSNSSTVVKGLLLLPSSLSDNILYCLEIFQYNISEPLLHLNLYKIEN